MTIEQGSRKRCLRRRGHRRRSAAGPGPPGLAWTDDVAYVCGDPPRHEFRYPHDGGGDRRSV